MHQEWTETMFGAKEMGIAAFIRGRGGEGTKERAPAGSLGFFWFFLVVRIFIRRAEALKRVI
jgi:hypothetical protein